MLLTCDDGQPVGVLFWQAPPRERKVGAAKVQDSKGLIDTQPVRGATLVRPLLMACHHTPATTSTPINPHGRLNWASCLLSSLSSWLSRVPDQAPGISRRRTTGCGSGCSGSSRRCRACSASSSTTRRCWRARSCSRARPARRSPSSCTTSRCGGTMACFLGTLGTPAHGLALTLHILACALHFTPSRSAHAATCASASCQGALFLCT